MRSAGRLNPRRPASHLPAFARRLNGHAASIDHAQVPARRNLAQAASAQERCDLVAFVLVDLAAERCDGKSLHTTISRL